jgi:hypothetical protein
LFLALARSHYFFRVEGTLPVVCAGSTHKSEPYPLAIMPILLLLTSLAIVFCSRNRVIYTASCSQTLAIALRPRATLMSWDVEMCSKVVWSCETFILCSVNGLACFESCQTRCRSYELVHFTQTLSQHAANQCCRCSIH